MRDTNPRDSDARLVVNDEVLALEWLGHKFNAEVKPVRAARDDKVDSLDLAMEVRFVLPASPETVPAIEACRVYYYDATWRSAITEPEGEPSGFWSIDAGNRYAAKGLIAFLCRKIYRSSILGKTPR